MASYIGRRKFLATLGGAAAAWPLAARAQQPAMPVVGYLNGASSAQFTHLLAAFRKGLSEIGFVEGRNFAFEHRWADFHLELMPALAADLVRRRVSVIVAPTTAAATAAKAATPTIPIVFQVAIDPVALGLVASFNRPGGNTTGVANLAYLLAAKRLELLGELVPTAGLFGVLVNPSGPTVAFETKEFRAVAGVLGMRLLIVNAAAPDEIEMGSQHSRGNRSMRSW